MGLSTCFTKKIWIKKEIISTKYLCWFLTLQNVFDKISYNAYEIKNGYEIDPLVRAFSREKLFDALGACGVWFTRAHLCELLLRNLLNFYVLFLHFTWTEFIIFMIYMYLYIMELIGIILSYKSSGFILITNYF